MATFQGAAEVQVNKGEVRPCVFFRLASTPVVRLWSGFGDFPLAPDAIEPDGAIYSGIGTLAALPAVSQLVNGVAERITFGLSGVDPEMLALAAADAPAVRFREVRLGVMILGEDWQPLSPVAWLWTGRADVPQLQRQPSEPPIRSVNLSVGSAWTGRRRPGFAFFTDVDQQSRHPGDRFCERTIYYSADRVKEWPRF